jgi:hypothetical protein
MKRGRVTAMNFNSTCHAATQKYIVLRRPYAKEQRGSYKMQWRGGQNTPSFTFLTYFYIENFLNYRA